jgi:hypothetical protein
MPAVKLVEHEEDDWHSLQPHGVQFEDYTTCDSAVEVCGFQTVNQVLDHHLTRAEEDEVAERKAAFFDTLKGLEAARKYVSV